jgi:hypothetical protein
MLASQQHPGSRRWAVFEDDGVSGWLYLTFPGIERPAADCWIYNRVAAPERLNPAEHFGGPPLAIRSVVKRGSRLRRAPKVKFGWAEDGESVALFIGGEPWGMIVKGEKRGYSICLAKDCSWGHPWDERLFQTLFR